MRRAEGLVGIALVGAACCVLAVCAVLSAVSPAPVVLETVAMRDLQLGDAELGRAEQIMRGGVAMARRRHMARKAKVQQLYGIGGIGAGEEDENEKDWEVAMAGDHGCQETLDLRAQGNPAWKRKGTPHVSCTPNRRVNPMQWPFAEPGKVWSHDSHDDTRDPKSWPYTESNLHDYVESAEPTPPWQDGIWHPAKGESYRRPGGPVPGNFY